MLSLMILHIFTYLTVAGPALFDAIEDCFIDLQLFVQYDVYDCYTSLTYTNLEEYFILFGCYVVFQVALFWTCLHFEFDFDNFGEWLDPGFAPQGLIHRRDEHTKKAEYENVKLPITVSPKQPLIAPLSPTRVVPTVAFKHFNATGNAFRPHLQPGRVHRFLAQNTVWRTLEGDQSFRLLGAWVYGGSAHTEKPFACTTNDRTVLSLSTTPIQERSVPPQSLVELELEALTTTVSTKLTQGTATKENIRLAPITPTPSTLPATIQHIFLTENQPVQIIRPQLPSPPKFEFICQELAMKVGELNVALRSFIITVDGFGDASDVMLLLGSSFSLAYTELRPHRDCLTLAESNLFGWATPISEFYPMVHPRVYSLGTYYDKNMLEFLTAVFTFGRYLGLRLPDLDLSPPYIPIAHQPTPIEVTKETSATPTAPTFKGFHFAPTVPKTCPLSRRSTHTRRAIPQQPPITVAKQTIIPVEPTKNHQAGSEPAQAAVPMAPTTSSLPQEQSIQPDLDTLEFDKTTGWYQMVPDALAAIEYQLFGWADETAARKKIYKFSAAKDLVLSGTSSDWTSYKSVRSELLKLVPLFKRAAVVLRLQALDGTCKDLGILPPRLLHEITEFFKQAEQMINTCQNNPGTK